MTEVFYVAVKGSLHAGDSSVFGIKSEEYSALCRRFPDSNKPVINGVLIKGSPLEVINSLAELGYRVTCSSGETEIVWTLRREALPGEKLVSPLTSPQATPPLQVAGRPFVVQPAMTRAPVKTVERIGTKPEDWQEVYSDRDADRITTRHISSLERVDPGQKIILKTNLSSEFNPLSKRPGPTPCCDSPSGNPPIVSRRRSISEPPPSSFNNLEVEAHGHKRKRHNKHSVPPSKSPSPKTKVIKEKHKKKVARESPKKTKSHSKVKSQPQHFVCSERLCELSPGIRSSNGPLTDHEGCNLSNSSKEPCSPQYFRSPEYCFKKRESMTVYSEDIIPTESEDMHRGSKSIVPSTDLYSCLFMRNSNNSANHNIQVAEKCVSGNDSISYHEQLYRENEAESGSDDQSLICESELVDPTTLPTNARSSSPHKARSPSLKSLSSRHSCTNARSLPPTSVNNSAFSSFPKPPCTGSAVSRETLCYRVRNPSPNPPNSNYCRIYGNCCGSYEPTSKTILESSCEIYPNEIIEHQTDHRRPDISNCEFAKGGNIVPRGDCCKNYKKWQSCNTSEGFVSCERDCKFGSESCEVLLKENEVSTTEQVLNPQSKRSSSVDFFNCRNSTKDFVRQNYCVKDKMVTSENSYHDDTLSETSGKLSHASPVLKSELLSNHNTNSSGTCPHGFVLSDLSYVENVYKILDNKSCKSLHHCTSSIISNTTCDDEEAFGDRTDVSSVGKIRDCRNSGLRNYRSKCLSPRKYSNPCSKESTPPRTTVNQIAGHKTKYPSPCYNKLSPTLPETTNMQLPPQITTSNSKWAILLLLKDSCDPCNVEELNVADWSKVTNLVEEIIKDKSKQILSSPAE